jgi:hypothetical protein
MRNYSSTRRTELGLPRQTNRPSTVVSTAMPTAVGDLGGIQLYAWVFAAYMQRGNPLRTPDLENPFTSDLVA